MSSLVNGAWVFLTAIGSACAAHYVLCYWTNGRCSAVVCGGPPDTQPGFDDPPTFTRTIIDKDGIGEWTVDSVRKRLTKDYDRQALPETFRFKPRCAWYTQEERLLV